MQNIEIFDLSPTSMETCRTCTYRISWQRRTKFIQYCERTSSGRTFNGLLKIKAKNSACERYVKES